jgi:hypothetical protein
VQLSKHSAQARSLFIVMDFVMTVGMYVNQVFDAVCTTFLSRNDVVDLGGFSVKNGFSADWTSKSLSFRNPLFSFVQLCSLGFILFRFSFFPVFP